MDIKTESAQRKEFCDILFELAKLDYKITDSATRSAMYVRLENLYHPSSGEEGFRHFYSDIFMVLTQIQQEDMPGNMEILGNNLLSIRKGYRALHTDSKGNLIDIQDNLRKLHDHVSLDIARINYSDAADRKIEQMENIALIRSEVTKAKESVGPINDDLKKLEVKMNDTQKEYITILGIFSSVVLTFTAGIAFSTSVLQNAHQMSIYKMVFVALTIGIVLLNVLYGLFYYINQLVRPSKSGRLCPLVIANLILLLMMFGTFLCWNSGVVEKRNSRFSQETTAPVAEEATSPSVETESIPAESQE